jgi:hypothetical protein
MKRVSRVSPSHTTRSTVLRLWPELSIIEVLLKVFEVLVYLIRCDSGKCRINQARSKETTELQSCHKTQLHGGCYRYFGCCMRE